MSDLCIPGWIARDKAGNLFLYKAQPKRMGSFWSGSFAYLQLDNSLFQDIRWESEPVEVSINISRVG